MSEAASSGDSATAGKFRILFVANDPPGQAVYRYRCANFADVLREAGVAVDVVYVGDSHVVVDHDIVVLHRICKVIEGRAYARAARACGAALVYGADDLVFDPEGLAADSTHLDAARQRLLKFAPLHAAMLRDADAVLLSTEFLADRARRIAPRKPVFVLRNFLSNTLLEISERAREAAAKTAKPKRAVTLGYLSGTPSHDSDLDSIAGPLVSTLTEFDNAELLLVGPVREPAVFAGAIVDDQVRRHAFVPWRELPSVLADVDINLAPLDLNDPLTQGKSEIKLLEAAALGIPTVASASAGFREALAPDSKGGYLAADGADWENRLRDFLADRTARRRAGDAAWSYLNKYGTAEANRAKVVETFAAIHAMPVPLPATRRSTIIAGSALSLVRVKYGLKAALRRLCKT